MLRSAFHRRKTFASPVYHGRREGKTIRLPRPVDSRDEEMEVKQREGRDDRDHRVPVLEKKPWFCRWDLWGLVRAISRSNVRGVGLE